MTKTGNEGLFAFCMVNIGGYLLFGQRETATKAQQPIRDERPLNERLKDHAEKLRNEAKEAELAKAKEPVLPPAWSTVPPDVMLGYVPDPFITKQAYNRLQIKAMQ